MLLSLRLANDFFSSLLFFVLRAAAGGNPSESADLGSSFQKHLIKVHHAVSIVKQESQESHYGLGGGWGGWGERSSIV